MTGAWRLALKEARDVFRERTIVLALVVQLFVAAFSTFLAVGLVAIYEPSQVGAATEMQVGYAGPGGLEEQIADQPSLEPVQVDVEEGLERFRTGELSAVVVEDAANASEPRRVQLWVPEGELRSSLLVNELKTALDAYEHELRLERSQRLQADVLRVEPPSDPPVSFSFVYGALLPLLVAAPAFLSGAISADSLSDEVNEGTLLVLRASPLSGRDIVLGKLATPVLLVPAQIALWMALIVLNGIAIASPGVVLLVGTAMGVVLSASGVLTAALARREGLTQAGYTIVVLTLAALSLLLPQDPANLVARAGVGHLNPASWVTLATYGLAALGLLVVAVQVVTHRMTEDRLEQAAV